jgi:hypothetical protein
MPSLITYANRHGCEIGDTVADYPGDSQEDDDDESYEDRDQSDKELDGYDGSLTDDESSSSSSSDDDDNNDNRMIRLARIRQGTHNIMPVAQALMDPDPPAAMIDPEPPANQLHDDASVDASEPDTNSGVEEMNFEPDEMGLDEAIEDLTNPGVELDVEDKVNCPMNEHEQFRAAEADGRTRALAGDGERPQRTVRPQQDPDFVYSLIHLYLGSMSDVNMFVTAQMSAKVGLRHFGQCRAEAIVNELCQLITLKVMTGCCPSDLTQDHKTKALKYLMFLKEK